MTAPRCVLVLTHVWRDQARAAGVEVLDQLTQAGVHVRLPATEWELLRAEYTDRPAPAVEAVALPAETPSSQASTGGSESGEGVGTSGPAALDGCDAVVVLGGDGTILRAAEVVRGTPVPIVGINLGHFGFLAEGDPDALAGTIERVAAGRFEVEERMTVDLRVLAEGREVHRGWALNEVTLEKAGLERMLDVVVEIDRRPLTRFGCDGIVVATPTGSTAYAFSAGGPVVWPRVEALLVTPIAAHALFARPLVVQPQSLVALETMPALGGTGVVVSDGRRSFPLPSAARLEVTRGVAPVRLARLAPIPFTERLVNRFRLPVSGWRGPDVGEGGP